MRTLTLLALLAMSTAAHAESFAGTLHRELARQNENLIYSPASISLALAMTREGATDETAKEMDAVLGPVAPIKSLGQSLRSVDELVIANRLYVDAKLPLEPAFVTLTRDDYAAPIEAVDFRKSFERARLAINKWVEERTKSKIANLLAPGILDKLTRLVLVNAIYFKAEWATPFPARNTKPAAFQVDKTTTKQVPMMRGEVGAKVGMLDTARIVDLPYRNSKLSLMIVVISKVIHRAFIAVDENGTEAAAATAVVMSTDSPPEHVVVVDRPFAFFLHDEAGNVLFAGRVKDPSN